MWRWVVCIKELKAREGRRQRYLTDLWTLCHAGTESVKVAKEESNISPSVNAHLEMCL